MLLEGLVILPDDVVKPEVQLVEGEGLLSAVHGLPTGVHVRLLQ